MDILRGLLGLAILLALTYAMSSNKSRINWRLVGVGVFLQLIFAFLILKVAFVRKGFDIVSSLFVKILNFSSDGATFLFGSLVTDMSSFGYIFAFQVLPTIVFFAALSSVLYYLGILQFIVKIFAWVMQKAMGLTGPESLAAAGNIFLGQTEAPLLVKPYLPKMTRSEIMALMTGGFATIAGSVLGAYIGFLGGGDELQQQQFATHLLSASIMSAPAALVIAKLMVPETEEIVSEQSLHIPRSDAGTNILDAITNGTTVGLKLAFNVGAMLLVFVAMIAMVNGFLYELLGEVSIGGETLNAKLAAMSGGSFKGLTLELIFGYIFAPVAWIIGVPGEDVLKIGQLLGQKLVINEFIAYESLGRMTGGLTEKSTIIATYALCGFANFASIGIQLGGIGGLAPSQQRNLTELGFRSMIGGTIACLMTGTIAGMFL